MPKDLVVKSNELNTSIQNLSLAEVRLIQLAIVDARETGNGLSTDKPLRVDASRYADTFDTTRQNAYARMKEAEETLFNRRFTFIDNSDSKPVKSRWVQQVKYFEAEGGIEIIFTHAVVTAISRIDGIEQCFTKYFLEHTADLQSAYAIRLYELLIQWRSTGKTPIFELATFRGQLGLEANEYERMGNFKKRVLDLAINEINQHTDITATYEQHKRGRVIVGFSFKFKEKKSKDAKTAKIPEAATAKRKPRQTTMKNLRSRLEKSGIVLRN